ncbi:OST6 [Candida theae]|uniref:OST6 n=1 Tax=Candida theae TaxID=1198502 RepID=A0AAD5FWP6_9ASCO|nr:OST6 [Candida theae]KAI5949496.1 OST6 [Candida theae]
MGRISLLPSLWIILSFSFVLLSFCPQPILAHDHNNDNSNASNQEQIIVDIHNGDLAQLHGHRNYYTVLIFTSSDPAHDCQPCQQVVPMVEQVTTTYLARYLTSETLAMKFYKIDLADISNAGVFRELEMNDIPHIWLVPPSPSSGREDDTVESVFDSPFMEYPLRKASLEVQVVEFAKFLSEVLMIDLHVVERTTINSNGGGAGSSSQSGLSTFAKTFIITFTIVALLKKKGPSFLSTTSRSTIMCYFAITIILFCIGGSQFTLQRQSPLFTKDEASGVLVFISEGSMHYQYAIEIFIVGLNYASLAASVIILIKLGNYQVTETSFIKDEKLRAWLIVLVSVAVYWLYSCLTSILLKKDPGYPYPLAKLF